MNALILMTRVPIPGQTKTRLMDTLSGEECVALHTCFLKDLVNTLKELCSHTHIFVSYTPEDCKRLLHPILLSQFPSFPQRGHNLGEKMAHGIEMVLSKGYEKVILIGSDIPDLRKEDIEMAFYQLDTHDLVLGPTYDGGYYLIGMKKPNHLIFQIEKEWGGKSVLESTLYSANKQGLSVGLATKYRDIDTKEDLFAFEKKYRDVQNPVASHTMGFIKEWRNGGNRQPAKANL